MDDSFGLKESLVKRGFTEYFAGFMVAQFDTAKRIVDELSKMSGLSLSITISE